MTVKIEIQDVTLKFRVYHNPSPALKDSILNFFLKKEKVNQVIEFFALQSISLFFKAGERIGIIGPNGAGKTTLLKMISGIYAPHAGRILIQGKVTPLIELGTGFDLEISGRKNIYLNGAMLGYSRKEMAQIENQIIEFAELKELIDMPVKYYSSGMFGRLAFSIATMIIPEILLVDELFSTGDAHFVSKASNQMLKIMDSSQIVVFVSHNLDQIVKLCNKVIVMDKGMIVNQGTPDEMTDFYLKEIVNATGFNNPR